MTPLHWGVAQLAIPGAGQAGIAGGEGHGPASAGEGWFGALVLQQVQEGGKAAASSPETTAPWATPIADPQGAKVDGAVAGWAEKPDETAKGTSAGTASENEVPAATQVSVKEFVAAVPAAATTAATVEGSPAGGATVELRESRSMAPTLSESGDEAQSAKTTDSAEAAEAGAGQPRETGEAEEPAGGNAIMNDRGEEPIPWMRDEGSAAAGKAQSGGATEPATNVAVTAGKPAGTPLAAGSLPTDLERWPEPRADGAPSAGAKRDDVEEHVPRSPGTGGQYVPETAREHLGAQSKTERTVASPRTETYVPPAWSPGRQSGGTGIIAHAGTVAALPVAMATAAAVAQPALPAMTTAAAVQARKAAGERKAVFAGPSGASGSVQEAPAKTHAHSTAASAHSTSPTAHNTAATHGKKSATWDGPETGWPVDSGSRPAGNNEAPRAEVPAPAAAGILHGAGAAQPAQAAVAQAGVVDAVVHGEGHQHGPAGHPAPGKAAGTSTGPAVPAKAGEAEVKPESTVPVPATPGRHDEAKNRLAAKEATQGVRFSTEQDPVPASLSHSPKNSGTELTGSGNQTAAPAVHAGAGTMTESQPPVVAHPDNVKSGGPFERIDSAPATRVIESVPQRLAVGVQSGGLGWVEIRTNSAAGQISATLASGSAESHNALSAQLPAVREFLAGEHVRIDHLASKIFSGSAGGRESGGGQEPGQGSARQSPNDPARTTETWRPLSGSPTDVGTENLSYISVRV